MAWVTERDGDAVDKVLFFFENIDKNYSAFTVFASRVGCEIFTARRNADVPIIIF